MPVTALGLTTFLYLRVGPGGFCTGTAVSVNTLLVANNFNGAQGVKRNLQHAPLSRPAWHCNKYLENLCLFLPQYLSPGYKAQRREPEYIQL